MTPEKLDQGEKVAETLRGGWPDRFSASVATCCRFNQQAGGIGPAAVASALATARSPFSHLVFIASESFSFISYLHSLWHMGPATLCCRGTTNKMSFLLISKTYGLMCLSRYSTSVLVQYVYTIVSSSFSSLFPIKGKSQNWNF
jgi:hypothetical protein